MEAKIKEIQKELVRRYPNLASQIKDIQAGYLLLRDCYNKDGKVLTCGNGGSAADAGHITAELMKGFLLPRTLKNKDRQLFSDEVVFKNKLQYFN